MKRSHRIFKRDDNIAWRVIDGEALVVDSKIGIVYPLNATATKIWELFDGRRRCAEIVKDVVDEFECGDQPVSEEIDAFIEDALRKGLIVPCD